jgi:hypothetical protein
VSECPNDPGGSDTEPTIEELRAALGAAIRDRAWRAVEIIQAQIDASERASLPANVVPLLAPRGNKT